MAYTDKTSERSASYDMESHPVNAVIDYHDGARWGPILAGLVVALSIQLVLSALGEAVGFTKAVKPIKFIFLFQ